MTKEELTVSEMMLNCASNYEALSSDETLRLVTIICNNESGKDEAINTLVNSCTKWIYSQVKVFNKLGDTDDFLQAGYEGFINGLNTISLRDLHKVVREKGFGYNYGLFYLIKGFVWDSVNSYLSSRSNFPMSDYRLRQVRKVRGALNELESFYGSDYDNDDILLEVARRTNLSLNQVKTALEYSDNCISMETPLYHDELEERDMTYVDLLSTTDTYDFEERELQNLVEQAFTLLSPIQQRVLSLYCGFGEDAKTVTEISEMLGKSRPTIYKIIEEAGQIIRNSHLDLDAYYYGA